MTRMIDLTQKEDEAAREEQGSKRPVGDGIDRRNFLECIAWAGTGLFWSIVAGVPTSKLLAVSTA